MNNQIILFNISKDNKRRIFIFFFWAILIFLSVYYLPTFLGIFISILLPIYTYKTKDDIVPLMLFSLIGLGLAGTMKVNNLPRITFSGGISLNTLDLMTIAIFLKIAPQRIFSKGIFSSFFIIFFAYIILNYISTSYLYGINFDIGLNFFRVFFYYIIYFYTIYSIRSIKDFSFIITILFIFIIIVFSFQLLLFFGKINVRSYLTYGNEGKITTFYSSYGSYDKYRTESVRAVMGDVLSPFLLFILSLSFINLTSNKKWNIIFSISIALFIISIFSIYEKILFN